MAATTYHDGLFSPMYKRECPVKTTHEFDWLSQSSGGLNMSILAAEQGLFAGTNIHMSYVDPKLKSARELWNWIFNF